MRTSCGESCKPSSHGDRSEDARASGWRKKQMKMKQDILLRDSNYQLKKMKMLYRGMHKYPFKNPNAITLTDPEIIDLKRINEELYTYILALLLKSKNRYVNSRLS